MMKKSSKILLIIGIVLTFLGLIISACALAANNFEISSFETQKTVENTIELSEDFENIFVKVDTSDISFFLSEDESCKIICIDTEKVKHTAAVEGSTLVLKIADERKWYDHIGFSFGNMSVKIYLPKNLYSDLKVQADTGDISVPAEIAFDNADIKSDTGDISLYSQISGKLTLDTDTGDIDAKDFSAQNVEIETDTGEIILKNADVKENIKLESDTGDIKIEGLSFTDGDIKSDTGDIRLSLSEANGNVKIESDTGDVRFEDCDAASLNIKTDTGDVKGTLLSSKIFIARSDTGSIKVPKTVEGGICEIKTSTGDINIKIKE